MNLDKSRFNKKRDKNWFTKTIVEEWNRLSTHVMSANTVDSLTRRLDKFIDVKDGW